MIQLPATKFQEQFWILNMLAPKSAAYHIPVLIEFDEAPDIQVIEDSVNYLVMRHEAFRTSFVFDDMKLMQQIANTAKIEISVNVIDEDFESDRMMIPAVVADEIHKPFNLENSPLLRVAMFKCKNNKSVLTIVFHHIIIDLHSKEVFASELSKVYHAMAQNKKPLLAPLSHDYTHFSNWHNEWLQSERAGKYLADWVNEVPKNNQKINLPFDNNRPPVMSLNGKRKYFEIDEELSLKIHQYAQHQLSYSFVVMLSAYAIMLHKLSKQEQIVIGVPLSNRRTEEYKDTIGCFVNIIPLVVDFSGQPSNDEIRKQVRQKMLMAHRKQEVPLLSIISALNLKRDYSANQLFQTGFTFEPLMDLNIGDFDCRSIPFERNGAQLDIFLTMWEDQNRFMGYLEYSTDLFKAETIEKMISEFNETITSVVETDVIV